jgi:hypothetical protein
VNRLNLVNGIAGLRKGPDPLRPLGQGEPQYYDPDLPCWNVPSPKVRVWGIEKGSRGQKVLYSILTLDVDTLMGAGHGYAHVTA